MNQCCIICGNSPAHHKLDGGRICSECLKKLPDYIRINRKLFSAYEIGMLIEYEQNNDFSKYSKTSGLGSVELDESHGIIAINSENSYFKKNKPLYINILDIKDCSLFVTNAKVSNSNVYCDSEFSFEIVPCNIEIKVIAKKRIRCEYHRVSRTQIEWEEPAATSFFRNIINQTYRNAVERYNLNNTLPNNKQQLDLLKARSLYMLEEDFTVKELKAFHPDVSGEDTVSCERIVLEAYETLLCYAKKEDDHENR